MQEVIQPITLDLHKIEQRIVMRGVETKRQTLHGVILKRYGKVCF